MSIELIERHVPDAVFFGFTVYFLNTLCCTLFEIGNYGAEDLFTIRRVKGQHVSLREFDAPVPEPLRDSPAGVIV